MHLVGPSTVALVDRVVVPVRTPLTRMSCGIILYDLPVRHTGDTYAPEWASSEKPFAASATARILASCGPNAA